MIKNFLSVGITDMDILVAYNFSDETTSVENIEIFKKLEEKYSLKFFYYKDTRIDKCYIPSVYFNIIKQHYSSFPELHNKTVFCHDCDIVFTSPPDFSELENNIWYFSDTNSYINYDYVISKGENIYNSMCGIVGIDRTIPIKNKQNSGGAQYIVKNIVPGFWEKVEIDSISLYKYFCTEEKNYVPKFENDYAIQKWTAGMWSFLYNSWYFNYEVKISEKMNFCMSTDTMSRLKEVSILHNAGVTGQDFLFDKLRYKKKSPFNENHGYVDQNYASYFYTQQIKEVV
jgi:hypothetical protein